jgi:hypothetical protein
VVVPRLPVTAEIIIELHFISLKLIVQIVMRLREKELFCCIRFVAFLFVLSFDCCVHVRPLAICEEGQALILFA